jgi:hypothetical protein
MTRGGHRMRPWSVPLPLLLLALRRGLLDGYRCEAVDPGRVGRRRLRAEKLLAAYAESHAFAEWVAGHLPEARRFGWREWLERLGEGF